MSEENLVLQPLPEELAPTEHVELPPVPTNPTPPEEIAAQLVYFYTPHFLALVNQLSKKAVKRLVKALVEYPLNDKEYKHTSEEEKTAFLVGTRLLDAKYVMIFDTYNKSLETLQTAADKAKETPIEELAAQIKEQENG